MCPFILYIFLECVYDGVMNESGHGQRILLYAKREFEIMYHLNLKSAEILEHEKIFYLLERTSSSLIDEYLVSKPTLQ